MNYMLGFLRVLGKTMLLLFVLFCLKVVFMFYSSLKSEKEFRANMMRDCLNVGISKQECERLSRDTWSL